MATAIERIVVQTTAEDKMAIAAKAKKLALPISELMRRGAFAYEQGDAHAELSFLADAAKAAADGAGRPRNLIGDSLFTRASVFAATLTAATYSAVRAGFAG